MLAYRGVFLAATILSASTVLADVLVQPGYRYDNKRHHSTSAYQPAGPQQQPPLPTEQYYANQLTTDQQHLKGIHAVYPYYGYPNYGRSHFTRYHPAYRHHYPYVLPHQLHYAKIGGHGYVQPSIFVRHPQPVIGHHRFRRFAMEKIGKPSVVKHDDGVATEPSLVTTKYSTAFDSRLRENEPVGTNNEHSEEKSQSKNDQPTTFLFNLRPQNIYRNSRQLNSASNLIKASIRTKPAESDPSTANLATVPKTASAVLQEIGQNGDNSKNQQQNQMPPTDPKQSSNPSPAISPSAKASDEQSASVGAPRNYYYETIGGKEINWPIASPGIFTPARYGTWNRPNFYHATRNLPDPRLSHHASWQFEPLYQQYAYQVPDKKSLLKSRIRSRERSKLSNFDSGYRIATPCNLASYPPEYSTFYNVAPSEVQHAYEPIVLTYLTDPNYYATYTSSGTQSNPTTNDDVQTSPGIPQTPQFLSTYDSPMDTRYVAEPQTYYYSPTLTYDSAPFEGTFSSPAYY
ncbi:uncharacterized protein LOC105186390 [Harpegnathos saltator]|uniref:uncharacterized protein LOC105186390 n=1 Tax=Harpegnathos saltator TaxID=610380 RepID=UPI00058B35E2|nr:uncharacterized protein LOC105186390 [Harpegnathos saltator]